jgi:hypothetical protein
VKEEPREVRKVNLHFFNLLDCHNHSKKKYGLSSILAISLGLSLYNETEEEIKTNTQNKTKNIEMG